MAKLTPFMARTPWPPLEDLEERFRDLASEFMGRKPHTGLSAMRVWSPDVEMVENEDEILLTAELPGLTPEDVEIEVDDDVLTVRGEKRAEREEKDERQRYHLWERSYGEFARSFTLPRVVGLDQVSAEFKDGVLEVHMPKTDEARGRRVEVRAK